MLLTAKLKTWLSANCGVAATAADDEFRRAAAEAMTRQQGQSGFLSPDEFKSLSAQEAPNTPPATNPATNPATPAGQAGVADNSALLKQIADGQKSLSDNLSELVKALKPATPAVTPNASATPASSDPNATPATTPAAPPAGDKHASDENDPFPSQPSSLVQRWLRKCEGVGTAKEKPAHTQYENTKKAAFFPERDMKGRKHMMAGMPCRESLQDVGGQERAFEHASDLEKAITGAWIKFSLTNGGTQPIDVPGLRMTQHDMQLVRYALENVKFSGIINAGRDSGAEAINSISVLNRRLQEHEVKALIDDNTSGGLEIAPIFFDDQVILTPLLFGELFPLVNLVNITRGRRIEGASMGNVTLTSGGADNVAITDFNTASFVAAFDTTIYVANGAVEIGLDFLSDSPIPVADIITTQYGNRLLQWLDEQIAIGDGTTEPQGIMVAGGTTSVSMAGAAPTVGQYMQLAFGVPKEYKQGFAANRISYFANETSYRRARQMSAATTATDQRLIFGYDWSSYMLGESPYRICTAMANTQIGFANFARYRMYRRAGQTVRRTMEGKTLMSKNLLYCVARSRWGGQLETGSAAAVVTNAQA